MAQSKGVLRASKPACCHGGLCRVHPRSEGQGHHQPKLPRRCPNVRALANDPHCPRDAMRAVEDTHACGVPSRRALRSVLPGSLCPSLHCRVRLARITHQSLLSLGARGRVSLRSSVARRRCGIFTSRDAPHQPRWVVHGIPAGRHAHVFVPAHSSCAGSWGGVEGHVFVLHFALARPGVHGTCLCVLIVLLSPPPRPPCLLRDLLSLVRSRTCAERFAQLMLDDQGSR